MKGTMQKLKTFFRTLILSCTSPKYYADVLKTRFSFSFKYFLFLQFLISLAVATLVILPVSQFDLVSFLNSAKDSYPANLVVQVENGRLSINQPLPYRIALPGEWSEEMMTDSTTYGPDLRYLMVFQSDENIQGAADVFAQDSFMVFTESTIYVLDSDNGGLRVYPVPEGEAFELNPAVVDQFFAVLTDNVFVKNKLYVPLIAAFFLLIVFPAMVLFGLIVSAIFGFFVWLMARLFAGPIMAGQMISYMKSVQVTFHSMTLITIIQKVLEVLGQGFRLEGWWYLLAFLAWTGFVLHQARHTTASSATVPVATVPKAAPKTKSHAKTSRKPARKGRK
jgi:hypothetical protein